MKNDRRGHLCAYCKNNYTSRRYVCWGCENSKKTNAADFDASIRNYEANKAHTTPKAHSPYVDAVRDLAKSLPVSNKRKREFVKAMTDADKKKGRGK